MTASATLGSPPRCSKAQTGRAPKPSAQQPRGPFFERRGSHPAASGCATANWDWLGARFEAHVLVMSARGRRRRFTAEERRQVLALAAEGASQREIAKTVFGHVRFRGRVERILAAAAAGSTASQAPRNGPAGACAEAKFRSRSERELVRELLGRAERAMLESSDPPALVDIERLVRLKRQLETLETVDRLNAMVRGKNRPAAQL